MTESTQQKPIRAGIYATVERADEAVMRLIDAGFHKDQITVICSDESKERHFGKFHHEDDVSETDQPIELKTGVIGGMLGSLVSLAGVVATGGVGIAFVGPILAGAVTGTLVGVFIGHGVENELARFYDQAVARGNILVAVEVHEDGDRQLKRLAQAAQILEECGAEAIPLDEG